MQTIAYGEPAPTPNMCFLCKTRPLEGGGAIVDTGINFIPDVFPATELNGRLLVCTNCISNLARHIGFMDADYVALLQAERDQLDAQVREQGQKIEELESGVFDAFQQLVDRHVAAAHTDAAPKVREPRKARA